MDFEIIWNVPWGTLYQNCLNGAAPLNKMATRAKNRKTFKRHLLQGHWPNFKIILLEYSLVDSLLKLLKPLHLDEQDGHQS